MPQLPELSSVHEMPGRDRRSVGNRVTKTALLATGAVLLTFVGSFVMTLFAFHILLE